MQVAGRAGRAGLPGEVMIQTQYPRHPLYVALAQHDYAGFACTLLAEREQAGFPPYVFEAVLRADAAELETALGFLREAVVLAGPPAAGITLYDPVPMTVTRVAERERAHLLVQSVSRKAAAGVLGCLEREAVCPAPARGALASGCRSDRVLMLPHGLDQSFPRYNTQLFSPQSPPPCPLQSSPI